MAAALFTHKAKEAGLSIDVASAGVFADQGMPASSQAVAVMDARGLSLADHRANSVSKLQFNPDDLLLTMTQRQASSLLSAYPQLAGQVYVLSEYVGQGGDIRDPFGGDYQEYAETAQELEHLITLLVDKLQQQ
jgi:ribose 5-phosphate isomerase B